MIILFGEGAARFGLRSITGLGGRVSLRAVGGVGLSSLIFRQLTDAPSPSRVSLRAVTDAIIPSRAWMRGLSELDASERERCWLRVTGDMSDMAGAVIASETVSVSIDGVDIAGRYESVSITMNQGAIHDSFDLASPDAGLFRWLREGYQQRVKISVAGVEWEFIAENISGNDLGFRLWGRSLSALEDAPYSAPVNYLAENYVSARAVCESLLSTCVLQWDVEDFLLPPGTSLTGAPIAALKRIADIPGAIVRAGYGANIIIRRAYPTRPIQAATAAADHDYDDDAVFEVGADRERGDGCNLIRIAGAAAQDVGFSLEIETSGRRGGEAILRMYWPKDELPASLATYATQGRIEYLGALDYLATEELTFTDGRANTSKPILALGVVQFYPDMGQSLEWTPWSTELRVSGGGYALAEVEYSTRVLRFRLVDHDIEWLLAAIEAGASNEIGVFYIDEAPVIEADMVSDEYLYGLETMRQRALSVIDARRYDRERLRINAPYRAGLRDGQLLYINDAGLRLNDRVHVEQVGIKIGQVAVEADIEVILWRV